MADKHGKIDFQDHKQTEICSVLLSNFDSKTEAELEADKIAGNRLQMSMAGRLVGV